MESFFSSLKTERTARKVYRTRAQARADVFDYIERFYAVRDGKIFLARRRESPKSPKSNSLRGVGQGDAALPPLATSNGVTPR